VNIAKIPQPLEQASAGLLHGLPVGVGIERHQAISKGTTAPQGNAQIVNVIGTEIGGNVVALLQNLQHPVAEAGGFFGRLERAGEAAIGVLQMIAFQDSSSVIRRQKVDDTRTSLPIQPFPVTIDSKGQRTEAGYYAQEPVKGTFFPSSAGTL